MTSPVPITFLLCGFGENNDLSISILVTLFPSERKAALFFINPMIQFEESKLEKNGLESVNIISSKMEAITDQKIDYKLTLTESNFLRIIDIIGGLPVFFDPWLIKRNSENYERQEGEYNLSGEELSDFLKLKNSDNAFEYLERLWSQETVALILYDRLLKIQKTIKKEWLILFAGFFETDLLPEEFVSLFDYIREGHLIVSISELPAEPISSPDSKDKSIELKVKDEVASIAYNKFVSDLRSEDFADGEFSRTEILNGTDVNGLAKRVKSLLNEKRIKVLTTDNAWTMSQPNTIIIDRSGNPEYAFKIGEALGIKNIKHIINKEIGLDTTIILGEDFEIKPGKK